MLGMAGHSSSLRTPHGVCAMCFGRKPLTHGWAWLKLCAECAASQGGPGEGAPRLPVGDAERARPDDVYVSRASTPPKSGEE